ncbi:MAG: carbamate kinase, partial [Candidatus Omnitrophica bacterium]|nr:carbamate kinase [Candidatus Omnitrophota bacterium]
MKQVPGKPGILRRVVPSPKPISIHPDNLRDIKRAIFLGKMVIAAGGGGIPVLPDGSPVEAVIDKDLATALLCREIKARSLIISTGVRHVAHNFQNPFQEDILYYQLQDALWNLRRGQYPAGAMGEKIEA